MLVQLVSAYTLTQRHLEHVNFTVRLHTSTLQPGDLGLAARYHSAHVHWPFLRDFPPSHSQNARAGAG